MEFQFSLLRTPYHLYRKRKHRWIISFSIAGFAWFCLFAFGAFEFDYFPVFQRFYLTGIYASACLLACLIMLFPVKNLFVKNLTLANTILLSMGLMAITGLFNFILTTLIFEWEPYNIKVLLKNLLFTLAIGAIITPFLILIHYNYLLRKKQKKGAVPGPIAADSVVTLTSDYRSGSLKLDLTDLLFIRSADNYIDICFMSGNTVKHKLLRNTLTAIEKELAFPGVLRCHRSYIINLRQVLYTGVNSGKLRFKNHDLDFEIPVSRKHRDEIARTMKHIQLMGKK